MRRLLALTAILAATGMAGQEGRRAARDYPKDGVYWVGTWKDAIGEAANRNVPIFVAFHKDGSAPCDALASVYRDRRFIESSRMWVNVVAHPGTAHDADVEIGGKKVPRCERYFEISCREHADLYEKLSRELKVDSEPPVRVYLNLNEVGRDAGARSLGDLIKGMDQIQARVEGEKVHADTWRKAVAFRSEGDKAVQQVEWQKAIKAYREIGKLGTKPLESLCASLLNKVNSEGEKLHTKAYDSQPKDNKGEFTATKKILRGIIRDFKSLPIADKAKSYLEALEKHGH